MGNKPSGSSRSSRKKDDVNISTKNIDDKLKNLNLEEWKKEIVKNKKNVAVTTPNNDEKDDIKHDDYDELISYLEKPFLVSNSVSIVSIIARLIRIYSGNVAATNLYNDKESGQLEGYKISMAIHPLNCDIYITDSQNIFKLKTTMGTRKDENSSSNGGRLVPIFRLPSNSNKLIKMGAKKDKPLPETSSITDISIDSSGKFLFYIVNSNYVQTYFLDIENININNNSDDYNNDGSNNSESQKKTRKTKLKTKKKTKNACAMANKELTLVDRSGIDQAKNLEWAQICFDKTIYECNFNHLETTVRTNKLATYDSCRDFLWYKHILKKQQVNSNETETRISPGRVILCIPKQYLLSKIKRVVTSTWQTDTGLLIACKWNELYKGIYDNGRSGVDAYVEDLSMIKYSIHYSLVIKRYCEKYCIKCSNNNNSNNNDNNKDYEKLYDKLCPHGSRARKNTSLDDIRKMKCVCYDFLIDIMALGVDKYYNAIYIILKNKMLYRLELKNNNETNNVKDGDDNYDEMKESKKSEKSETEKKEMEKNNDEIKKNIDWHVTHRVNLREKLKETGGIPMGLCVIRYDSVLGRLIIADNFNIQALYI